MRKLSDNNMKLITSIATVLLVLLLLFLIVTRVLGYIGPFLIAILIASWIENPVRLLQKRLKLGRGLSVAIVIFLFVIIAGSAIVFLFYKIFMEVWNLTKDSPSFQNIILYISEFISQSESLYFNLPDEVIQSIQSNVEAISNTLLSWVDALLRMMMKVLQSLPQVFLYVIISLVSAFFLSRDREKISRFVFAQFPESWGEKMRSIKNDLLHALAGYIKAQCILISITFIQVLVGYSLLGLRYAFFLAVLTGFFDLLPVFGPGTILVPGAVIYMMAGNKMLAFAFIALYISVLIVRQLLEPRIIGGNIGLHPLVTLIFIYLGFRVFGIVGLILGPIFAIILKSLQKAGVLPQWKQT